MSLSMDESLNTLLKTLRKKKLTVAFAESMTGGYLANEFSKQFDIGKIFLGSVVTYHEDAKQSLLKVSKNSLEKFTAESREVTIEMVRGLIPIFQADIAVAVTGLATPGGSEHGAKPVGTTYVAISYQGTIHSWYSRFYGERDDVVRQAAYMIFEKMLEVVEAKEDKSTRRRKKN